MVKASRVSYYTDIDLSQKSIFFCTKHLMVALGKAAFKTLCIATANFFLSKYALFVAEAEDSICMTNQHHPFA